MRRGDCARARRGRHACRLGYDESGRFRIAATPDGVLVTTAERLEMHDARESESNYLYLSPGNAENHAFLLKAAPANACK